MEKKLRENARWNVNKTIRCLVRNKIKHRKKYKIGKSYPRVSEISLSCTPPGVRFYISHTAKNRNCAVSLVRNVFRWEAGSSFPPVVCKQGRIQDLELRGAWVGKGPGGRTPPPPKLWGFEELQTFIWTTIFNQPHHFYQTKKTLLWVLILSDNC
jgi:hypothetical protein